MCNSIKYNNYTYLKYCPSKQLNKLKRRNSKGAMYQNQAFLHNAITSNVNTQKRPNAPKFQKIL